MDKAMEELRGQCLGCEGCVLGKTRTKLVFGDGKPNAKVMLVGEGPGEQEDLQGIPFVGRAGFLLDDMMKMIDLDRTRIYSQHREVPSAAQPRSAARGEGRMLAVA